jgi:cytochrome b
MPGRVVERAYVWDRFVRLHHWSLAALVLLDAFAFDGGGPWHRWAGYAALGLVGARIVWGVIGSRYARFASFFPTPSRLRTYLAQPGVALRGHNPLGAVMVLAMLGLVVALGITGWLMGTDAYWGEEWLEDLHETLSDVLLACVALHLAGVTRASLKTRINLPRAMLTGYKTRGTHSAPFAHPETTPDD